MRLLFILFTYEINNVKTEACIIQEFKMNAQSNVVTIAENCSSEEKRPESELLQFVICVEKAGWKEIAPVPITYKDGRTYLKFQKNWTDVFYHAIYHEKKLPCPFSFKKAQFFKLPGFPYFYFPGKCPECSNTIVGVCHEKPDFSDDNPIEINVVTRNTKGLYHYRTRNLTKNRRKELKSILKFVKVKYFKDKAAATLLTDSGKGIELLNHSGVLQKVRQEGKDEEYGVDKYPGDPIESVHLMMRDFSDLREFATNPFLIYYWFDTQMRLVSEAAKRNIPITIDASGRFVTRVLCYDGHRTSHLFLYVIVIRFGGKIYPVGQMLSERHDVATISMWLMEWTQCIIQQQLTMSKEVIVDGSAALLNAISLAFNGCFYEMYLDTCLALLQKKPVRVPATFLRRDRNHLMVDVCRWNVFKASNNCKKREFYLRVVGYCLEIECFELLKKVLYNLFLVSLCEKMESGSLAFRAKNWLEEKIETYNYYEDLYNIEETLESNASEESYNNFVALDDDISQTTNTARLIFSIYNEALKNSVINDASDDCISLNCQFLPDIANNFIRLGQQFATFTNVMRPFYRESGTVATTTGSENYFRIMRNEYAFERSISVNRFLLKHRILIEGSTKLGFDHILRFDMEKISNQPTEIASEAAFQLQEFDIGQPNHLDNQDQYDTGTFMNRNPAERFVDEEFDYTPLIESLDNLEFVDENNFLIDDVQMIDSIISEEGQNNYYLVGFPNPNGKNMCWLNASLHIFFTLPTISNLREFSSILERLPTISSFIELQELWKRGASEIEIYNKIE